MSTIFSRIIAGELPAYRLYEDEYTLAFLDIRPMSVWHCLVVPKVEVDLFVDVPEPYYSAVFQTAKIVWQAMMASLDCERVATLIEWWEVPHFHYHLIPMYHAGDLDIKNRLTPSSEELEAIQQKIIWAISFSV